MGQGQQQGAAGGCGVAARPLLNKGLLLGVSGNPEVAPGSKEPAPEECGVVKFLHVGLLLLGQPEASSGKEQAAVRGRCCRC